MRGHSSGFGGARRALRRASIAGGIALSAAAAACQSTAGPPDALTEELVQADLAQTFTLSPGQVARIGRDGPYLAFRRVSADSRCPMDVVCVWMGDAVVRIEVGLTQTNWTPGELHTDPQQPPLDVGAFRIRLTELQPYPRASEPTDASRYQATFQVTRR